MPYTNTQAQGGLGTLLQIGSGTPVTIGELNDFPFNRPKWQTAEATNSQSTSSEFVKTIKKGEVITFKGNRVRADAGQTALEAAYQSPDSADFTLQLPPDLHRTPAQATGDKYAFKGLVLSSDFHASPGNLIEFTTEIQITNDVTETLGT